MKKFILIKSILQLNSNITFAGKYEFLPDYFYDFFNQQFRIIYFTVVIILLILSVLFIVLLLKKNRQLKKLKGKTNPTPENSSEKLNKPSKIEELNQKLFAQKLEIEQRNTEVQRYIEELKSQKKELEIVNQKLFAQKLEVEQRNFEVEQYIKEIEQQKKEQIALNQKMFAQKLEVEQRNTEIELYTKSLEKQQTEQEALNQKMFAQKLVAEQRSSEIELYSKSLEKQQKQQETLNQKLFAQKIEVEQRNFEVKQYINKLEDQKKMQDKLNQKLFAQSLEVDQKRFEIEMYSKELEKLKNKAEAAYNNVNSSIHYAKNIIDSLLPAKEKFDQLLPGGSFILFKPKDIIGGDYYFLNNIGDYTIISVADCTGHGVPGALISMLGITFLNEITQKNLVDNTGEGLNLLRENIKTVFKSYGRDIQNKNGMDISICAINNKNNTMQYSGAFNSIYIIRDNELTEYKATRNPIGYYPVETDFKTNYIQLKNDDVFYLFTDGFRDQTNHESGKKMRRDQFKQLLFEIHKFPMEDQKKYLEEIFVKWRGNKNQIDDVTIMGIKWKI